MSYSRDLIVITSLRRRANSSEPFQLQSRPVEHFYHSGARRVQANETNSKRIDLHSSVLMMIVRTGRLYVLS